MTVDGAAAAVDTITSLDQLHARYGEVVPTAIIKELDHISAHYRAFIEASPFVVLATSGPEGLDCSPRGDPAGFIRIADERTLMLPDRRGNNRLDSLRNIVRDPRVALLVMVPGVNETLRVNGRAHLTADPAVLESFAIGDKVPACVIVVAVESVYSQCPKALVRSRLWDHERFASPEQLPSAGERLEALTGGAIDAGEYDAAYPERLRTTIY